MASLIPGGPRNSDGLVWVLMIGAVVFIASMVWCHRVGAQDVDPLSVQGARALTYGGQDGVWVPLPQARELLWGARQTPRLQERVTLLSRALELAETETRNLSEAVNTGTRLEEGLREVLAASHRAREAAFDASRAAYAESAAAEAERDAWYRSPLLWFIGGLVLGVGGCVAVALSV